MSATLALKNEQPYKKRSSFCMENAVAANVMTSNSLVDLMQESHQSNVKRRKSCSDALDLSAVFSSISGDKELQFPTIDTNSVTAIEEEAENPPKSNVLTKNFVVNGYRIGGLVRSKAFANSRAA